MTDQSRGDNLTFTELRAVRQNLQFITLMWITSTTSSTMPESIERFLTACRKCFEDADSGFLARAVLGDALVGISTALEQRREEVSFIQLKNAGYHTVVWQLVRDAEPSDLTFACEYFGHCISKSDCGWLDSCSCSIFRLHVITTQTGSLVICRGVGLLQGCPIVDIGWQL